MSIFFKYRRNKLLKYVNMIMVLLACHWQLTSKGPRLLHRTLLENQVRMTWTLNRILESTPVAIKCPVYIEDIDSLYTYIHINKGCKRDAIVCEVGRQCAFIICPSICLYVFTRKKFFFQIKITTTTSQKITKLLHQPREF